jgi:hypothetical protein
VTLAFVTDLLVVAHVLAGVRVLAFVDVAGAFVGVVTTIILFKRQKKLLLTKHRNWINLSLKNKLRKFNLEHDGHASLDCKLELI